MNPNVLTAAISAGAAVITAVVAILTNSRGFSLLDKRIDDQSKRIDDLAATPTIASTTPVAAWPRSNRTLRNLQGPGRARQAHPAA